MKTQIKTLLCRKRRLLLAALIGFGMMLPGAAHAATFTVTKLADTNDGACDADCSLREAVTAANSLIDADVVDFSVSVRGQLDLTMIGDTSGGESALGLSANVAIQGPGANELALRRSSSRDFRLFYVLPGVTASISGLTLSNGKLNGGGGILNSGSLTIQNSILSSNSATADGGALYNLGTLTMTHSTLSGNIAMRYGGGFLNAGTMTVQNCTLSGNSGIDGSGIAGSAIMNYDTLTLQNSTLVDEVVDASLTVSNKGNLSIGHTIVKAAGQQINFGNSQDQGAVITSLGYNISNRNSSAYLNQPTDLNNTDPLISLLADNGGVTTTCALQPDSAALNAGDPSFALPPATDQRGAGFDRVSGGRIDIGAFEVQYPSLSVNDTRVFDEGSVSVPVSPTFTIALAFAFDQTVTVNYFTTDGSAKAGSDYVAKSGKLTFLPGETKKLISVRTIGDSVPEPSETFFLDLKTPTNATIADSRGVASIRNDDGPSLSIFDAAPVDEGKSTTTAQSFIVRLSAASTDTVTVNWATASDSAGADDFVAAAGTLTFAPGQTSKRISVLVTGDSTVEPNETYKVNLSKPAYAVLADAQAIGTIRNDDAADGLFQNGEPSE